MSRPPRNLKPVVPGDEELPVADAGDEAPEEEAQPVKAARKPAADKIPPDKQDWSGRSSEEALAAGCKRAVLCKDGYFVPDTAFDKQAA